MISIEEAKIKIEQLQGKQKFEKMVQTTAILTSLFEIEGLKPIIVGGLAVEIYTRNEYTTLDIDIIFSQRDIADKYLKLLGFVSEGRHWYHDELMISVEIPNDILEDADNERVVDLVLKDGLHVYVIGLEDIILDRLRACVHWKSSSDCEWGRRLFLLHFERIDINYLKNIAQNDQTIHTVNQWLNEKRDG
ncbi:hypothetical protein KFZ58_00215 [Virgibacillus sp. NKC19-16]|uniref:nucleotidyltransferase family protein n=1 Tax=Virgibacillus salidurans TaxID=2831673 RepID=UPI001F2F0BFF|nr:nucleotidyltransferase family protein [Virgibacillus sp. NKC19-16]UJL46447.1 hypothetical protein KFZ58_00215 [Virgibacillus sp. NKC19-16]